MCFSVATMPSCHLLLISFHSDWKLHSSVLQPPLTMPLPRPLLVPLIQAQLVQQLLHSESRKVVHHLTRLPAKSLEAAVLSNSQDYCTSCGDTKSNDLLKSLLTDFAVRTVFDPAPHIISSIIYSP